MTEKDWAVIRDIDEETWSVLPESTRRAILALREMREEVEAADG